MKTLLALVLAAAGSDWSQFRGPNRDGISPDTGLLKEWPAAGPPLAWKATGLGAGFSTVTFAGDLLFTMGDVGGASTLIALSASDGKISWTAKVGTPGGNRNEGPRSTPATDGTLVFALGQAGELVCVEAATGREKWRKHLEKDFGGRRPGWWWSESPLLDGDLVLCTPGGAGGTVLALKRETGETAWRSADLKDTAHYASLVPVEIGGARQYLVLTARSIAGISAAGGQVLWRAERLGKTAVVTTPVYRENIVFVTSAYKVGCNAFKVSAADGKFSAEEIYAGGQMENHHGGVILVGEHLYGTDNRSLKCIELKTGRVAWEDRSVGKGSVAYADGRLVVRSERGPVALVEATPEAYREKGRFNPPDRTRDPSWAHPVVFGGRLYLRDQDVLLCYDLKPK